MSAGIFLVQGDRLVEMTEQGYASEDLLQALIARFPSILAGDLGSTPRRWLLIKREMDLESEDDWSGAILVTSRASDWRPSWVSRSTPHHQRVSGSEPRGGADAHADASCSLAAETG